jgi:hypothetical protein
LCGIDREEGRRAAGRETERMMKMMMGLRMNRG